MRITYAVVTEGATARSEISNLAIIVPLSVATAPAGLTATAKAEGVVLAWAEPKTSVRGEEAPVIGGYRIYRNAPGEAVNEFAVPINTAPVRTTTYTDTPQYGDHEYRVTAVAVEGSPLLQSNASAPVSVSFRDLVRRPRRRASPRWWRREWCGSCGKPSTHPISPVTGSIARRVWDTVQRSRTSARSRSHGHADRHDLCGRSHRPWHRLPVRRTAVDKSGNESSRTWTDWVVARRRLDASSVGRMKRRMP